MSKGAKRVGMNEEALITWIAEWMDFGHLGILAFRHFDVLTWWHFRILTLGCARHWDTLDMTLRTFGRALATHDRIAHAPAHFVRAFLPTHSCLRTLVWAVHMSEVSAPPFEGPRTAAAKV